MTSHEFSATPQSSLLEELKADPNQLLRPENLNIIVFNPEQLVNSEYAGTQYGLEQQDSASQVCAYARTEILGPESAVKAANERAQLASKEFNEALKPVQPHLDDLDAARKSAFGLVVMLRDITTPSRYQIHMARDILQDAAYSGNTDQVQETLPQIVYALETFGNDYQTGLSHLKNAAQEADEATNQVASTAQQSNEVARQGANGVETAAEDARQEAPSAEIIEAVAQRGAGTLSDHKNSCEEDVTKTANEMRSIARSAEQLYESAIDITVSVRQSQDTVDDKLPNGSFVLDEVQELKRNLYQMNEYGSHMVNLALETVERLDHILARIEGGIDAVTDNHVLIQSKSEELSQQLALMKSNPLLEV